MGFLTKDQILKARGRRTATVTVPEWGGEVKLVSPSADAALRYRELQRSGDGGAETERQLMVLMLSNSLVNEAGDTLFDKVEVLELLKTISIETLTLLSETSSDLMGTRKAKAKDAPEGQPEAIPAAPAPEAPPPGNSEASPSAG